MLHLLARKLAPVTDNGSKGGADICGVVQAEDSLWYFVKDTRGGDKAPASEWVGAHLADKLNLPAPTPKILQMEDHRLLFGSRSIGLPANKTETSEILTSITHGRGATPIPGLQSMLSKIYAFDMFINNYDRHDQNFLSIVVNGHRSFYVIDLARSLFSTGLAGFPRATHQTRITGKMIRARHGFNPESALRLLDDAAQLAPRAIIGIMETTPDEWLSADEKRKFVDWWSSERLKRIESLRQGLIDGSLL